MKKIDQVAAAFAELNHKIINDLLARGYTSGDAETLAEVRESLLALKGFAIEAEATQSAATTAKVKAGS